MCTLMRIATVFLIFGLLFAVMPDTAHSMSTSDIHPSATSLLLSTMRMHILPILTLMFSASLDQADSQHLDANAMCRWVCHDQRQRKKSYQSCNRCCHAHYPSNDVWKC